MIFMGRSLSCLASMARASGNEMWQSS